MKVKYEPLKNPPKLISFKDLIEFRVKSDNKIAFRYRVKKEIVEVTAQRFKENIEEIGTVLYNDGFKDAKIALIGENSYEWIAAYFAIVNGGNVVVPLDKELPAADLKELIERSGATALIYSETYTDIKDDNPDLKGYCMKDFPEFYAQGRSLIEGGNTEYVDFTPDGYKMSSIIFTSGTTGKPKGVMLTPRNILSDIIAAGSISSLAGDTLLTLPLHHTFAFSTSVVANIIFEGTTYINASLRNFKKDLVEFKPRNICVVPLYLESLYKNIWSSAKEQKKDKLLKTMIGVSNALLKVGIDVRRKLFKSVLDQLGGNLDLLVAGGAPISDVYTKGFADLGITVINGYGITECSPVVSVNRQSKVVLGSVGPVCNCCEVKIKDGEILVKGENVMLGYFQDEEATKEAFDDGWFKTGDLGYMDGEYLYITGRKKNLIILSNGKNVSPEELEDIILTKTTADEVIVYQDGDMIAAEIYAQVQDGIQEAINEINKTLPVYKQIHKISFRDTEFEKTTTKKIKRKYN